MFSNKLRNKLIGIFVCLLFANIFSPASASLQLKPEMSVSQMYATFLAHNNKITNKFIDDLKKIHDLNATSNNQLFNLSATVQKRLAPPSLDLDLTTECKDVTQENFNISPVCLYSLFNQNFKFLKSQLKADLTEDEKEFIKQKDSEISEINFHTAMYYSEFFDALPKYNELTILESTMSSVRDKLLQMKLQAEILKIKLPNATSAECT